MAFDCLVRLLVVWHFSNNLIQIPWETAFQLTVSLLLLLDFETSPVLKSMSYWFVFIFLFFLKRIWEIPNRQFISIKKRFHTQEFNPNCGEILLSLKKSARFGLTRQEPPIVIPMKKLHPNCAIANRVFR